MVGRRGFFGLLAGGIAAAPAMAQEAAGQLLHGGGGFAGVAGVPAWGATKAPVEYDPLADAKRDLARLIGKTAVEIAREKRTQQVTMFDGDIASMRSLSWHAKIAMQRERNWQREQEQQRGWIEDRIASLLSNSTAQGAD